MEHSGVNYSQKFIKVVEPVSFNDILNSDKKCRVEHALVDDVVYGGWDTKDFNNFNNVLHSLSEILNGREFRKVIKEGKWYLEN